MRKKHLLTVFTTLALTGLLGVSAPVRAVDSVPQSSTPSGQQKTIESLKQALDKLQNKNRQPLTDKRLATCMQHQETINSILKKSAEQAKKHLAVFQKIEAKVRNFYTEKGLKSEDYNQRVATADARETIAATLIDSSSQLAFSCDTTDATNPGEEIKTAMHNRNAALQEYQRAVKNLILVVKKSINDSKENK